MSDSGVEIYRQRYETFRHLDKLRWQMAQLVVAILSAAALVFRASPDGVGGGFWGFLGISFLTIAVVMGRISQGLARNGEVLRRVGSTVGDDEVPHVANQWRSVTHWLTLLIGVGGLSCLVFGLTTMMG